jgi:uncharacterized glyoxalase superfamily protein PhnB
LRAAAERIDQGGACAAAHVEDVDAHRAELKGRGAEVRDWPWSERSFRVSVPDGSVWTSACAG